MSANKKDLRIGEENINNNGDIMKVIEYNNANDIVVEFQDEYKTKIHTAYHNFKNGKVKNKTNRLGEINHNNEGILMKIVEYNNARDIIVEFQDKHKAKVNTEYWCFTQGCISNPMLHIGEENFNNKNCLMKIVNYNKNDDIVVEFQDKYKAIVHTQYNHFLKGDVKNPYYPSVCGVGMIGDRYPVSYKYKDTKEYATWHRMLYRCFDKKTKEKSPTYKNVTCCNEWLLFDNFYEWLHAQSNFNIWINNNMWALDKDIISKRNKTYSPDMCCLVPQYVNCLFIKNDAARGALPIGVEKINNKFRTTMVYNAITKEAKRSHLLDSQEEAFFTYKKYKEDVIKQVAKFEYDKGNITKVCYDAMMSYEIEIDD